MGFLDRFKGDTPKPDALTLEVATRIHVLPGVDGVDMIDADTVAVTWTGRAEPEPVDLSECRPSWKRASGFERIEIIDGLIAGLPRGRADSGSTGTTIGAPLSMAPAAADDPEPSAPVDEPGRPTDRDTVFHAMLPWLRPAGSTSGEAVQWPVGELLAATASADSGAAVTETDCARWGVAADQVRDTAVANLVAHDPAPDPIAPGARAWVPTVPDGRQSAWLAAPDRLLSQVGLASAIVLAPAVGELVVVDPDDAELVRSVLTSTLTIIEQASDPLCPVPFLVAGERVEVWDPPADDPAAALVARARELFGS